MKFRAQQPIRHRNRQGFTLVESLFAMAMAAVMFGALYSGLAFGYSMIKSARENSRATQIMVEKMETIRLYTWTQLTNPGFVPTAPFVVPYYAVGPTNSSGLVYTGQITIADSSLGTSYADNMKKITIKLNWEQGGTNRTRSMSTYVSRNGLQNYVW